eukprot:jgi/Mesen1/7993/ME000425S07189
MVAAGRVLATRDSLPPRSALGVEQAPQREGCKGGLPWGAARGGVIDLPPHPQTQVDPRGGGNYRCSSNKHIGWAQENHKKILRSIGRLDSHNGPGARGSTVQSPRAQAWGLLEEKQLSLARSDLLPNTFLEELLKPEGNNASSFPERSVSFMEPGYWQTIFELSAEFARAFVTTASLGQVCRHVEQQVCQVDGEGRQHVHLASVAPPSLMLKCFASKGGKGWVEEGAQAWEGSTKLQQ